jgi:hypothetical protein
MDLEIPARAGVAGNVSKPSAELLREIATEVWAEGALPAAQPSEGDTEVVQGLMVGGVLQPVTRRRCVREVAEGHESDGAGGGLAKVVDARGHCTGIETFCSGETVRAG